MGYNKTRIWSWWNILYADWQRKSGQSSGVCPMVSLLTLALCCPHRYSNMPRHDVVGMPVMLLARGRWLGFNGKANISYIRGRQQVEDIIDLGGFILHLHQPCDSVPVVPRHNVLSPRHPHSPWPSPFFTFIIQVHCFHPLLWLAVSSGTQLAMSSCKACSC